jgi:hypothetical protein
VYSWQTLAPFLGDSGESGGGVPSGRLNAANGEQIRKQPRNHPPTGVILPCSTQQKNRKTTDRQLLIPSFC